MHPYMVSTTLYVIQRMAQLAALFMFAGTAVYLHGRIIFSTSEKRGYWWMTGGICVFTLLAVFSKENGLLLPLTLLAIESCLPSNTKKIALWWRVLFLWLPTVIIFLFLLKSIKFTLEPLPGRQFSQLERLMTEPRIIWEYLYHLYVPRIEGRGLFQDGYVISKSLFSPVSTFFAASGLLVFIVFVFKFRQKAPLWGIAFLYFFFQSLIGIDGI